MLNAAIVGIGWWGHEQAKAVDAASGLNLYACFTRNEKNRAAFARQHGCRAAASYEELLDDDDLHVMILTTPDDTHADLTRAAADAGKHVFVEKPMASTAEECSAMIEACRTAGVRLGVGHHFRRLDVVRKTRELVASGRLGEIVGLTGCMASETGKTMPPEAWRSSNERCPAGVLSAIGVHVLDLCNHLMASADAPSRPRAVAAFACRKLMPGTASNVSSLLVRFDGDASASLHFAHIVPWIFQVAVLGTEANLYLSAPKPLSNPEVTGELHLQPAGGTQREEVRLEPCEPLILQLDAFASAIRNGAEHDVNGEEGRRTVAVVEAAIKSSMSGAIEPVVS